MKVMFRGGSYDGQVIDVDDSLPDYWDMIEHRTPQVVNYADFADTPAINDKITIETYTRKDFYKHGKYLYSEYHGVKL